MFIALFLSSVLMYMLYSVALWCEREKLAYIFIALGFGFVLGAIAAAFNA